MYHEEQPWLFRLLAADRNAGAAGFVDGCQLTPHNKARKGIFKAQTRQENRAGRFILVNLT
jgi:hypothetical protein